LDVLQSALSRRNTCLLNENSTADRIVLI
jgi:hypothetical protein